MITVAIQGIRGSYSEEAAMRFFGPSVEIVYCLNFEQVFEQILSTGIVGVVPLFNSITGRIRPTAELLERVSVTVLDETALDIRHVLAGTAGADFADVRTVRSHPEALRQCSKFLKSNPHLKAEAASDTATSIREVIAVNRATIAAIGSLRAVHLYGARVLCEEIADEADNRTTFYLIGK